MVTKPFPVASVRKQEVSVSGVSRLQCLFDSESLLLLVECHYMTERINDDILTKHR